MSVSIVWLDEGIARIYHFSDDRMVREVLPRDATDVHDDDAISGHLEDSKQILILSPGGTGQEFIERIKSRSPEIARRIVGCEALASPDDAAVADFAIKYFRKPVKQKV